MSEERSAAEPESTRDSWLDRLIGRFSHRERDSVREDLGELLAEATEAADLSARERSMMRNVLALKDVRVSDVMVPRADVFAIAAEASLGELIATFRKAGHSRLPAYAATLDEPLGMVHIRDLLDGIARAAEGSSADSAAPGLGAVDLSAPLSSLDILRPVLFVPQSMPVIDLLARMQASRTHMALVIDEYGGTDGLVSIEDLVETVVGDIQDEHDETSHAVERDGSGSLIMDGRASLEEAVEALGDDSWLGPDLDGVETLGGLIVARVGRVPVRGEVIEEFDGLRFEVLDADIRRLKRLRVSQASATEGGSGGSGPSV